LKQLLPNVTPEELREVVILEIEAVEKTALLVAKQTGIPAKHFDLKQSPKESTKKPRRKRHVPFDENKQ
jgi:phosphosulfolactate phosphohydrolase-like enzyme